MCKRKRSVTSLTNTSIGEFEQRTFSALHSPLSLRWHWLTLAWWRWGKQSGHQTQDSPYLRTVTLVGYHCSAIHPITTRTFLGYLWDWFLYHCVCVSGCVLLSALFLCLLPFLSPFPYFFGSKLEHLQKIPTTLTLIQLKATDYARNMSNHRFLHIMVIDRAGLTGARILHTSAVHNWSDNSPRNSGCSNCLLRWG